MKAGTLEVLNRLSETLLARRHADPSTSYTASLFAILKKIGEESAELIMAAKDGKRLAIVNEATDVVYHILVLMAFFDLSADDILQELHRREGISGIDEKRARSTS